MWFALGNDGGLVKYNPETGEMINYLADEEDVNAISSNTVRAISEDSKGNIWLGTQNGLNKLDVNTGKFKSYTYLMDYLMTIFMV